jgi:hypothetical protein
MLMNTSSFDTPEHHLQSSWLLDCTYGSIHTLNALEVGSSSGLRDSAVLDVFTSVDASDFTRLSVLGGAEHDMNPFLVCPDLPYFDRNSKVASAHYNKNSALNPR